MQASLSHHSFARGDKTSFDQTRQTAEPDRNTFAGISGTPTEASSFLRLDYEPKPLARVGVKLVGGLFSDSVYLERLAVQKIAAPILGQAEKVLLSLGYGAAHTIFRVSAADAEVLVVGENIRSGPDRANFAAEFSDRLQSLADSSNLLRKLAAMPANDFYEAWFCRGIRPDPACLPALRAVFALAATLDKFRALLTVDRDAVVLPDCKSLVTKKQSSVHCGVVGTLVDICDNPGAVGVAVNHTTKISLRAPGKGYIAQLNQEFRVGDVVRIKYDPVVDLLQPFQVYPTRGNLKAIELA